jgi:hypothetical protein
VSVLPIVFVLVGGPLARLLRHAGAALASPAVAAGGVLLSAVLTAMQFQPWPLERSLEAGALDGLDADNLEDPVSGRLLRAADARRGLRPVVLLADEYLPRGRFDVTLQLGAMGAAPRAESPAARITVVDLDGRVACTRDVALGDLTDRLSPVTLTCTLPRDGPATLAVFSLGAGDFMVGDITMRWK